MKITARKAKDYSSNWVQTVSSIAALLFTILVGFGVITPEQSSLAQPEISTLLTSVSAVIAGVIALIGILFKPKV